MAKIILNEKHISKISELTSIADIMIAISAKDSNKLNYLKGIFDSIESNENDKDLVTKKNLLNKTLIDAKLTAHLDD